MNLYLRVGSNDYERVKISDIKYVEADSNYCTVVTTKKSFIFSRTLASIEEEILPLDNCMKLVRIHRSFIINRDYVDRIYGNVLYIGEKQFTVSKTQRENVFKLFRFIC